MEKKPGREYTAIGGAMQAKQDRDARYACNVCGEWWQRVWDKRTESLVAPGRSTI